MYVLLAVADGECHGEAADAELEHQLRRLREYVAAKNVRVKAEFTTKRAKSKVLPYSMAVAVGRVDLAERLLVADWDRLPEPGPKMVEVLQTITNAGGGIETLTGDLWDSRNEMSGSHTASMLLTAQAGSTNSPSAAPLGRGTNDA
ncbi:recombinase family protein [Actinoplanes sp. NEAU-A12]|uniref:Recombinase family protein n=1 Tax=Actinoplanes sandaracinus TaxID=3045177 RepID=A0ABT6WX90_9ACTN|nr:recombinase family protein [Actinoplanes sandaracinus]MDI6104353.1 recombinase family protein [Actinoplanes sandaracinus]